MKKALILTLSLLSLLLLTMAAFGWQETCQTSWNGSSWDNADSPSHAGSTGYPFYVVANAPSCTNGTNHPRFVMAYRVSDENLMVSAECPLTVSQSCCVKKSFNSVTGQSYYVTAYNSVNTFACGPTTGKLNNTGTDCPPN